METLVLIKCTNFDPYLMDIHVRTEGGKLFSLRQNLRLLVTLFGSKPHIIIIFHLKIYIQKLEKHHVNGSQTHAYNCCKNKINLLIYGHILKNENIHTVWL